MPIWNRKKALLVFTSEQLNCSILIPESNYSLNRHAKWERKVSEIHPSFSVHLFDKESVYDIIKQLTQEFLWIAKKPDALTKDQFMNAIDAIQQTQNGIMLWKKEEENILFRNPNKQYWFKERDWSIENLYEEIRFFLEYSSHTGIQKPYDYRLAQDNGKESSSIRSSLRQNLLNDVKKRARIKSSAELVAVGKLLKDYYQYGYASEDTIAKIYRCILKESGKSTKNFRSISLDSIRRKERPAILLSIYTLTKGGGELIPLALANELTAMDYHVYLHVLKEDPCEEQCKQLLYEGIPMIITESVVELKNYIESYGIRLIHTHHQANQSLIAALYHEYPTIHKRTRHIATTHGMYECLDETALHYLLKEYYPGTIDQWVYVEEKNLLPFQECDPAMLEHFVMIPEAEIYSCLYDKIRREYSIDELQDMCRLREGFFSISDMARAYERIYMQQWNTCREVNIDNKNIRKDGITNKKISEATIDENDKLHTRDAIIYHTFGQRYRLDSSFADKMDSVGMNTGNLLFATAIENQIAHKEVVYRNTEELSLSKKDKTSTIVIPMANYIRMGTEEDDLLTSCFQYYTENPLAVIGLGAQNTYQYQTPKELTKHLSTGVIRTLHKIAQQSRSIGIRGEYTAACLEELGIYNFRIIGCPSLYVNREGIPPALREPTNEKVVFGITGGTVMETKVLEFAMKNSCYWIMQMETEIQTEQVKSKLPLQIMPQGIFPNTTYSGEEIRNYQNRYGKIFFQMEEWNLYLQKMNFTFAFGSRFHGNVAALRNGIPAVFLVHDSRTWELVETMALPYITYSDLCNIHVCNDLLAYCDYSEFNRKYAALTKNYLEFLKENNLVWK